MQLRGLDMNLVIALDALLRERSVTRAAKAIGREQSSMSHLLARLRVHFADPLFVKVGRELVWTERAKGLEEPVARAIAELERVFLQPPAFTPATSERVFHIAAPDNAELYLLPKLLPATMKEAPRVGFRFHPIDDAWPKQLLRGDIDLKLGRRSALGPELKSQDLFEEDLACFVRDGHPLADARPTVQEWADIGHVVIKPHAGFTEPMATIADGVLAKHGKQRRIVLSVPHFVLAPFIVQATDLVLTASTRLIEPFMGLLKLRRLRLPFKLPTYRLDQVWARRADDDPESMWLRSAILRAAGLPAGTAHRSPRRETA